MYNMEKAEDGIGAAIEGFGDMLNGTQNDEYGSRWFGRRRGR
jgi:hypothetical protein